MGQLRSGDVVTVKIGEVKRFWQNPCTPVPRRCRYVTLWTGLDYRSPNKPPPRPPPPLDHGSTSMLSTGARPLPLAFVKPAEENPVAMMVTWISPLYLSSTTAPKMMLAVGSARLVTTSDTMLISCSVRSDPPVMLYTMPVARSMECSMSGAEVAASAASVARFLPCATPTPSIAVPELFITARTSAKSTLTSPATVMMSEIPCTPCRSTSSARRNASCSGVPSSTTSSRRSLGMTMSVSTLLRSASIASIACVARRRPSKVKGSVTTPTVRLPASRDRRATTGAEPLPVPPPMPAVTNTRSAPCTALVIMSLDSSAAFSPSSGLPPVPKPRVTDLPICRRLSAWLCTSACASVFRLQNSTPCSPLLIMRFTALPPPPPHPMTLMRASGIPSEEAAACAAVEVARRREPRTLNARRGVRVAVM
mmetsp:Transcript_19843/g.32232  ORF Transcript_19843/g.32232 Transcript_19843/m.32232 type:complete len:423 (-) Transcript_19843:367-1635(-)